MSTHWCPGGHNGGRFEKATPGTAHDEGDVQIEHTIDRGNDAAMREYLLNPQLL